MKSSPNKGRLRLSNARRTKARDLSPPKCSIYLHQLFRFGFTVSSQLTCDVGLVSSFCSSPDGSWRENVQQRITRWLIDHLRRLPPHGSSPPRSCPRLVLSFIGVTFGILPRRERNRN